MRRPLEQRLRALEARRLAAPAAGAVPVDSEVSRLMRATAHHADRGAYLAGLLRRLEGGTTRPDDPAGLCSLAVLRMVHKLETET